MSVRPISRLVWLVAFTLLVGVTSIGVAAEPASIQATSPENLEKLVETLEDDGRREALVRDLRALIAAQQESAVAEEPPGLGTRLLAELTERVGAVSEQLVVAAAVVFDLPVAFTTLRDGLTDPDTRALWLGALGQLVLVLIAGIVAEMLARIALRRPRGAVESRADDDFWLTVILLAARTVLDLVPIAVFAAAAYGGLTLFGPDQAGRLAAITLINASVLARGVTAVARMLLAPRVAELRLFPIGDETANYLFVWIKRLTNLTVYGYFLLHASRLLGLHPAANEALLKALGLAVGLLLVMLVLQNRGEVARWIRGDSESFLPVLRRRVADVWHILMIVYLAASYTVWALEISGGFEFVLRATVLTITIVIVGRLIELSLRKLVARAFALGQELKTRLPGLEARANRYLPLAQSVARGVLYVLVLLAVLQAWGLDVFSWFASEAGRFVIGRAVMIALIVCLALVFWEVVSALIERYLSATDSSGNSVKRSQRARTLLPLLRNVFTVVLAVVVTMTVLSELGLNIGPLLAGAGVVGLAVGFGAQTLVKDVITGVFILLEDTISAGDVIEVAGHSGVVEGVTIRTIRLRDASGTVHTVPFSDVSSIKNLTRDFSYAFMEIGVAYREDIDAVIPVIEQLGAELRADPDFAGRILEDIQVQGLDRFDDSAVIIRARIKTKPLQQWGVRRAFNLRMKRRFDELGIEIPFPHQTVYFGEDRDGKAPAAPVRLLGESEDVSPPKGPLEAPSQTPTGRRAIGEDQMGDDGV
ncbi:MAG: mechanosensitive ion channel [Alphaproteobacteria bacterium]|nr:mechanosensitive ion channel [Alphaproteobacteria bacterium]